MKTIKEINEMLPSNKKLNRIHMWISMFAAVMFIALGIKNDDVALIGIGAILFYLSDIYAFLTNAEVRREDDDDEKKED